VGRIEKKKLAKVSFGILVRKRGRLAHVKEENGRAARCFFDFNAIRLANIEGVGEKKQRERPSESLRGGASPGYQKKGVGAH